MESIDPSKELPGPLVEQPLENIERPLGKFEPPLGKFEGPLDILEQILENEIARIATAEDPAHDLLHFQRVVKTAKKLCLEEQGDLNIVVPAAWLHDCVIVPKNDPRRSQASRLSALRAIEFLKSIRYPEKYFAGIAHTIECHSFSANIAPKTLEAQIVQDADRLDGLGAIGVARCFATSGILKNSFYSGSDPFRLERQPNDQVFTIDHFYKKLFKIAETLQTAAGRREGARRLEYMHLFIAQLSHELS